jgi:hypothetical protein
LNTGGQILLGQTEFEFFFNSICMVYLKNEGVTYIKEVVKVFALYSNIDFFKM